MDRMPFDIGGSHGNFVGRSLGENIAVFGAFAEVDGVIPGSEIIGCGVDEMGAVDCFERDGVCGDRGGCGGDVVVAAEEERAAVLRQQKWCGTFGFEAQDGNFSAVVRDKRNGAVAVVVFGIELHEDGGLVLEVPIWQENVFCEDGALFFRGRRGGRKKCEPFSVGTDPAGDMAENQVAGGVVLEEGDAGILRIEENVLEPDWRLCGAGGWDAKDGIGGGRVVEKPSERTEIQFCAHSMEKGHMIGNFDCIGDEVDLPGPEKDSGTTGCECATDGGQVVIFAREAISDKNGIGE